MSDSILDSKDEKLNDNVNNLNISTSIPPLLSSSTSTPSSTTIATTTTSCSEITPTINQTNLPNSDNDNNDNNDNDNDDDDNTSSSETTSSQLNNLNSPIYIFLDFKSSNEEIDNNPNKIDFIGVSYSIVDIETFNIIQSKNFEFNKINSINSSSFQDFIQDLTDSIHSFCILKEKPFTFIIIRGWDFRIKFIKHAKDIGAQLPNYLEYARYFDLKKEFIKFQELNQFIEFNSLNYNNLSLNSIKDNLKIINSNNNSLSNIDIMISIVKKIFEINSSQYIFKKPHDMNLDLSHFFIEKSRILYMTNLSCDTTQSELESWFNQFNGRTIAFWCIKSPNIINNSNSNLNSTSITPNDSTNSLLTLNNNFNLNNESIKTYSGFAIFANHEDAIEALSMNGQLLNDKLIELQPSSVRVLDKAQDILSPFPSSKNKPRPGDWTCPSCGFSNFQRRTACFRCSFPATSAAAVQESIYGNNTSSNSSNINISNKGMNNSHHSNINNNNNNNSNNNNSNSNGSNNNANYNNNNNNNNNNHYNYNNYNNNYNNNNNYMNSKNDSNGNNNMSNSNGHGNNGNNGNSGYSSRQSSNVPFRAGDWKCINEACAYHNFAKNVCCLKCGSPRVQSAIINGHAHNQHRNNSDGNGSSSNHGNNNNNSNNNNSGNNNNGHHHNKTLNTHNQHLINSNYSSRSNSLPSHMNVQFNQHYGNNNNNSNNNSNNNNQGQGQGSNYNKFKASDLYNIDRSSVSRPGTPTINGNRGGVNNNGNNHNNNINNSSNNSAGTGTGTSSAPGTASGIDSSNSNGNDNVNINNMISNQFINGNNNDFDLASRVGGLTLNHTGTSGSSNVSGTSGINSMLSMNMNMNNLNNLNHMNSINNMNNINGLNGLNNLNGLNGLNGLNNINMNMNNMNIPNLNINGMNNLNDFNNLNLNNITMNNMNLNNMNNNMNNLNNLNNLNMGMNLNGINGLDGFNNSLNGINGFTGFLNRTMSSPIIPNNSIGGGNNNSNNINDKRLGLEESVIDSSK
ncbi:blue light receptor [Pichia californica]|uniref:Blue light receptor n=1 Tax=Pichia californica TaxID=460514 RepID=A0A9P6WK56_9ASCO|nr:blue light receptor [[Candida] californica]